MWTIPVQQYVLNSPSEHLLQMQELKEATAQVSLTCDEITQLNPLATDAVAPLEKPILSLPEVSFPAPSAPNNDSSKPNRHLFRNKLWYTPMFYGMIAVSIATVISIGKLSSGVPSVLPLTSIHHSDTVDGYVEQAKIAYSKGDQRSAMDAWQRAIDRAKNLNYKPVAIGNLYIQAGDEFGDVPDFIAQDGFETMRGGIETNESRAVAEIYWVKAAAIFHSANLDYKELQARYRLMHLWRGHLDVGKKDNLLAILALTKSQKEADPVITDVNYDLARECNADGDFDAAAKYYSAAMLSDQEPGTVPRDAIRNVAKILRGQGKYSQLIHLLKAVLKDHPITRNSYSNITAEACLQQLRITYMLTSDTKSVDEVQKDLDAIRRLTIN